MGFPGVGWLFAGFPFTASILLMVGPALTWAVIPVAFSPYGQGPLRDVGWKVELVWLPAMALLSSALLYRAHARRRARLDGRPPRGKALRVSGYRARVSAALGGMALLLVAIPFVPAFAGVGGSTVRYSYEPRLTREVTGQFVSTKRGPVKLFAWSDPQSTTPADALRLHARDVRSLLVRAAALDSTNAYQLYDLDRGGSVQLRASRASSRELVLAPRRPLRPGSYAFVATHEGMFGGRDYAYLRVVSPSVPATAISFRPHTSAPAVLDALLPLCAALLALAFGAMLLRSFLRRRSGEKVLWGLGFLLFAVAAGCEALAQRIGWSTGLFRIYYLAGGVLTVAYLGAGSAWLLLPRRARDWLVGGLAVATAAAVVSRNARGRARWHTRLDRSWAAARELRTRGPRVPLGCRAQLSRQPVPDRRCALFDRAAATRAGEPLDRRRCTDRRPCHRPLAGRLVPARLRRRTARDRADVRRIRLRRKTAAAQASALDPVPRQVQPEGETRVVAVAAKDVQSIFAITCLICV